MEHFHVKVPFDRIAVEDAVTLLRRRLCDNSSLELLLPDAAENYSKLQYLLSNTVTDTCNNSVLLLGPRGCGKSMVLERVLKELQCQHPDMISVVRLNGLLHSEDRCALKEIAKQLCYEHELTFSRTDADQLLEKRVRSRFSHRKLLFSPPSVEDLQRLLEHALLLPTDSNFPHGAYAAKFNARLMDITENKDFKEILNNVMNVDLSVRRILDFIFRAVCDIDQESGLLSLGNFRTAFSSIQRQPKMETLRDASVLELYLLVSMKRLEGKECESYNFNAVMKEYEDLHAAHPTCDLFSRQICLRAFEHLLERQLISFTDTRGQNIAVGFRPVKLLVSSHELHDGLRTSPVCPVVLRQWFDHEKFK